MIRAVVVVAVVFVPAASAAQIATERWQMETRVEVLAARTTALHAAAGANAVMGTYARVAILGAGGARSVSGAWRASGRVESIVRFHVDPLRQFSWGAYAGGGGALFFDRGASARVRALVVIGYEGPPTDSGWIAGIEAGVGGGTRVALTARRARDGAR